jgi:hypothetical protein
MATVGNESNEMKPNKRDDMSTHTHTHSTAQTIPSVNQNLFLSVPPHATHRPNEVKKETQRQKKELLPRHRVSHVDPVKH